MAPIKPSDGLPFVSYFLSLTLIFSLAEAPSVESATPECPAYSAESSSCSNNQFDVQHLRLAPSFQQDCKLNRM